MRIDAIKIHLKVFIVLIDIVVVLFVPKTKY